MRSLSYLSVSALAVLTMLSVPSYALAEEKAASQPHSRILPVKIHPVQEGADNISKAAPDNQGALSSGSGLDPETLGILTSQAEGGLGSNLWKGQSRKLIATSLHAIQEPISAPIRDLLVRLLTTKATPPTKSDKDSTDLFALRLQKLVSIGEFSKAVELYKKHDDETPVSPAAVEAGIEALIGSGKMGLACLESKAAPASLGNSPSTFLTDVDFFCKALLSPVSGSDDTSRLANAARVFQETYKLTSPDSVDDLNKMGLLHVLSLFKTGKLSSLFQSAPTLRELSDKNIALLLGLEPEPTDLRLMLAIEGAFRGLLTPQKLGEVYAEVFRQREALLQGTPKGGVIKKEKELGAYDRFLSLYTKVASAGNQASIPDLTSLLRLSSSLGGGKVLVPLASLYAALPVDPVNLSDQEARVMTDLILLADQPLPVSLANRLAQDDSGQPPNVPKNGEMILLERQGTPTLSPENEKTSVDNKISAKENSTLSSEEKLKKTSPFRALSFAFEETNDRAPFEQGIYDNIFYLTGADSYVMPSTELIKILRRATKERHAGEVILVGIQILSGQPFETIHPAALYLVLSSFKAVGLSEETVSLVRLALVKPSGETKEK